MPETFHPTIAFGFSVSDGRDRLHQLWVGDQGTMDWRPVPYLDISAKLDRTPSVAGFVPEDEE